MKVCQNCKTKNFDISDNCEKCGQPLLRPIDFTLNRVGKVEVSTQSNNTSRNNGVGVAAIVFLILSTVWKGITLLFAILLWMGSLIAADMFAGSGFELLAPFAFWYFLLCVAVFGVSLWATIFYSRAVRYGDSVGIGFKICTLLLIDLIAGILMLCDSEYR